jgi:tripartite-type tricarboxylate transporter receptor subunit TctC
MSGHSFNRRRLLQTTGLAAAAVAAPSLVRAQDYPARPITMIVPFNTGGYNDRLARAFAPFLQAAIGQPVTVENRPGAGSLLGHTYFLQQPADGYTILCTSAAPYIPLNVLIQDAPFAVEDFHMINLPSRDYTMAATAADSEVESIEQFFEGLKADPTAYTIGIQPQSADLVNLTVTCQELGIDTDELRMVTYDGGGPTRNAAAGGVVDVSFVGGQGFLPLREQIRPLMVYTEERESDWPDTMSYAEFASAQGISPRHVSGSQRGFAVQRRFVEDEPARYATLLAAIEAASKSPDTIEALTNAQLATRWYGPDASNTALRSTAETMAQFVDLLRG